MILFTKKSVSPLWALYVTHVNWLHNRSRQVVNRSAIRKFNWRFQLGLAWLMPLTDKVNLLGCAGLSFHTYHSSMVPHICNPNPASNNGSIKPIFRE